MPGIDAATGRTTNWLSVNLSVLGDATWLAAYAAGRCLVLGCWAQHARAGRSHRQPAPTRPARRPRPDARADPDADPGADAQAHADARAHPDAQADPDADAQAHADPDAGAEAQPGADPPATPAPARVTRTLLRAQRRDRLSRQLG